MTKCAFCKTDDTSKPWFRDPYTSKAVHEDCFMYSEKQKRSDLPGHHNVAEPGAEVCDLCSDPQPVWVYAAEDVAIGTALGMTHGSIGAWAACDPCHDLIEKGDREGLAQRSEEHLGKMSRVFQGLARQHIRQAHDAFFLARKGTPSKLTSREETE